MSWLRLRPRKCPTSASQCPRLWESSSLVLNCDIASGHRCERLSWKILDELTLRVEKDTIIAAIGSAIGLAGLLLIFVGFVYTHGESFSSEATKRKFQRVAKAGIAPFSVALASAWFCLRWLQWSGPG